MANLKEEYEEFATCRRMIIGAVFLFVVFIFVFSGTDGDCDNHLV